MDQRKVNKIFLYLNVFCLALNAVALLSGAANFLTVLAMAFNVVAIKVLLDALKR